MKLTHPHSTATDSQLVNNIVRGEIFLANCLVPVNSCCRLTGIGSVVIRTDNHPNYDVNWDIKSKVV